MFKRLLSAALCLGLLGGAVPAVGAAGTDAAAHDTSTAVNFTQVKVTDDFWGSYQKLILCETIFTGIANVEKSTGGIQNIKNAAKKNAGETYGAFQGALYVDSDVYKLVEAMCYALMLDADGDADVLDAQQRIQAKLDEWVPYFVGAQETTGEYAGYFDSYFILGKAAQDGIAGRFYDFDKHELYCAGHFYEAAVAHYRATGSKALLDVAVKNADMVARLFGYDDGQIVAVPGHAEIELALFKLGNLCAELGGDYAAKAQTYYDLSEFFLELKGRHYDLRHGIQRKNNYDQDHLPLSEQTEAWGHAVRAGYIYTAMADWELLTGGDRYDDAMAALWDSVVNRKSYVTGGIGSNPAVEGFGDDYYLPNDTAYCETCASVANVFWNESLLQLYGDSQYADVIERALYNGIISCINLDGNQFFYGNPLMSGGAKTRSDWFGTACCPPNLMRLVMSLGGYIYTQTDDTIRVNLYVGNEANITLADGDVGLSLTTGMPWAGANELTLALDAPQTFTLKLRVPDWAAGTGTVKVNGQSVTTSAGSDGYITLTRAWADGDTIAVDFPIETARVYSDPQVTSNAGLVAIQRGPLIYCAEEVDNDYAIPVYYLPTGTTFTAQKVENLTGGEDPYGVRDVVTLTTTAKAHLLGGDVDADLTFVPYFSWCNRGKGTMAVWISETPVDQPLKSYATPSASYTNSGNGTDSVRGLNDGTNDRWTSYNGPLNPWVQYDFEAPVSVWGSTISWYDDGGGVQVPDGMTIQYWDEDADQWADVTPDGSWTYPKNTATAYTFQPVSTTKLRIQIKNDVKKKASGIMEWDVTGTREDIGDVTSVSLSSLAIGDAKGPTKYDQFNVLSFAPVTAKRIRFLGTSAKPMGLIELRVKTADGTYVEADASVSASYYNADWSGLVGVNNGEWGDDSYWKGAGGQEAEQAQLWSTYGSTSHQQWLEYTFDEAQTFTGAEAYFYRAWDDGVIAPESWTMQYYDETTETWVDCTFYYALQSFDPDVTAYEVTLPVGLSPDTLFATSDDRFVTITTNMNGVPGRTVATVTYKYDTTISKTYTIDIVTGDVDAPTDRALAEAPVILGDVNYDGKITISDVRLALRAAVGKATLTNMQKQAADVNKDNNVTVSDVRKILRYAVGKITQF